MSKTLSSKMRKSESVFILVPYVVVFVSYSILFLEEADILWLCKEDGLVEQVGAALFLMASLLFFAAYFYSLGTGNQFWRFTSRRNVFYLMYGIVLFVSFGEEISWGQRVAGWETPQLLTEMNSQAETNLHNMWLFDTINPDGTPKSAFLMMFSAHRLFSVFWFVSLTVVPVTVRLSLRFNDVFAQINLPVAPLWLGLLFLLHALFFHALYNHFYAYLSLPRPSLVELREANYAFIILLFALRELARSWVGRPRRSSLGGTRHTQGSF